MEKALRGRTRVGAAIAAVAPVAAWASRVVLWLALVTLPAPVSSPAHAQETRGSTTSPGTPAATPVARAGSASAAPHPRAGGAVDENDDNDNAARRARVSSVAKLALPAGTVQVIYPLLPSNGPDAAALGALADGAVLGLTRSMAIKLKTEVELRFDGGAVARVANVAPGYPGVYSLWLRRAGEGWRLVLNREPDIWGTMRDPAADVGEAALSHQRVGDAAARTTLEAALVATDGGGELTIAWGVDRFVAHFEAGPGLAAARAQDAGHQGAAP
jgi:hypothetical protein